MTRWHDAEGRALKSEVRRKVVDRLTLSGTDEPAVHLSIHEARHYHYPRARGASTERVLRESGAVFVLRSEQGGVLFQDTGHLAYAPGDESAPAGDQRQLRQLDGRRDAGRGDLSWPDGLIHRPVRCGSDGAGWRLMPRDNVGVRRHHGGWLGLRHGSG